MKNIVKVADPLRSSVPAVCPLGISPTKRKIPVGCPFELGVRVIRTIRASVAERGMAVGGRLIAPAFKDLFPKKIHSIQGTNLNSGWSHIHSLRATYPSHEHTPQRTPQGIYLIDLCTSE
ncbi:hypothetical protein [Paenibacillus eucommiae]|uniref:Uncharacterized protein n=1 Tax=Paenibacillus eucommiae TaxID=1355755 RepID=A0ABS4J3Y0_9BACL|nr:hypothetical protein [Paenibacillus eucommiae]MBP1994547.1 hypothetical protein [Paenibacillus eucommiae]